MKARIEQKSKGPRKISPQQVVYELKHRVVLALSKISDRDTHQIGVEELEKTAQSLNSERIIPFLSCILDTDSEQKSAVRKECVRMMGVLARIHGGLIGPHLGKMVSSIVRRLKDQDSVVRDTCVETMGIFASEFGNSRLESDGVFVLLVRPLFEALGEQNKHIQSGSAMCLARVIDNSNDPPTSIVQKMLARTMKLLKNPNFMAKPAVIELNKSLIQAGGALSHSSLSTAISSIQEALKDSDWTTRKAASSALGEIGSSGGPCLAPFKPSCVQALESCRFDKVKPVRDTVLQALSCWRSIEENDKVKHSDSKSTVKGNLYGDNRSDLVSGGSSMWEEVAHKESITNVVPKKSPLSVRNRNQNYAEKCINTNNSDWHVDIVVPKKQSIADKYLHNEESESSTVTKTLNIVVADVVSMQDVGHGYDLMDEKQEYSSASNHFSDNFSNKFMAAPRCSSLRSDSKSIGGDQIFAVERSSGDRESLESTVIDNEDSRPVHVSCSQTKNEISFIRLQLAEIQKRQSSLMDLLQVFTTNTMDTLSVIKSKVSCLEHAVDKIAHDFNEGRYAEKTSIQYAEKCQNFTSALSTTSTPRPSIEMCDRKSSTRPSSNREVWEGKAIGTKSKSTSISHCLESRREPLSSMMNRSLVGDQKEKNTRQDLQSMSYRESRKPDRVFPSIEKRVISEDDIWKRVKGLLCEGDLDSAYGEALYSRNQRVLIELIDATGPVLDSLSNKTISNLFSALAACILEPGIVESLIPWLQQIVDLSAIHGPSYIPLSVKVRREIIRAVQEVLDVEVTHPSKRRLIAQLAMKLQQNWGKYP